MKIIKLNSLYRLQLHAFVEYETIEIAEKAVSSLFFSWFA